MSKHEAKEPLDEQHTIADFENVIKKIEKETSKHPRDITEEKIKSKDQTK